MSNFLMSSSTIDSSQVLLNPRRLAINYKNHLIHYNHHSSIKCNQQKYKRQYKRLKSSIDEDPDINNKDTTSPVTTKTKESNDIQIQEESEKKEELNFTKVLNLDELPKGERREVTIDGKSILVFWYRNEIMACESRSPAEAVYSVGFKEARFTEDYGIICPTTDTVFSLKTGEILDWYPTNFVLKLITPKDTCRPLELYPVKVEDNEISISFDGGTLGGIESRNTKGGANTSAENDNVFFMEPTVYIDNPDEDKNLLASSLTTTTTKQKLNPVTILVGTVAVAIISVSGTALSIYFESIPALLIFWIVLFSVVASYIYKYLNLSDDDEVKEN